MELGERDLPGGLIASSTGVWVSLVMGEIVRKVSIYTLRC